MILQHTVFAMITSELSQEGHRRLRALRKEFAENPAQRHAEDIPLPIEIGREEITYRRIDSEPAGVKTLDEFIRTVGRSHRGMQYPQRVLIF
jgi:hypothetical protein